MTILDLNTRIADVLGTCETRLREIIFDAARAIYAETPIEEIVIPLEEGEARVHSLLSAITIAGQHVGSVADLLKILEGLCRLPGIQGASPPPANEPPPPVQPPKPVVLENPTASAFGIETEPA